MAARRKELRKVDVWFDDGDGTGVRRIVDNGFVAESRFLDEPVKCHNASTALACVAGQWQRSDQPNGVEDVDKYVYTVLWDPDADEFVATVADFPHLEARANSQMEALFSVMTRVGSQLRELVVTHGDIPEPGLALQEQRDREELSASLEMDRY